MKLYFLFYSILFISSAVMAQKYDSWKIFNNRKELASYTLKKESDDERKVILLSRMLEDPGFFIIEFTAKAAQEDWIRTIAFFDTSGKQIKAYNNTLFLKLHNTDMALILDNRGIVKVYSWAVPKDPEEAAKVKVRRILLCTLYIR
ncbi:MAG TPA: hypothetical protein VI548_08210 [Chitinophagaceae bacterium]|nr:hypothetical protein [Chitinophagaceae bacterium]